MSSNNSICIDWINSWINEFATVDEKQIIDRMVNDWKSQSSKKTERPTYIFAEELSKINNKK